MVVPVVPGRYSRHSGRLARRRRTRDRGGDYESVTACQKRRPVEAKRVRQLFGTIFTKSQKLQFNFYQ